MPPDCDLQCKIDSWLEAIWQRSLNNQDKQAAYNMFLCSQLTYPLGCTSIEANELRKMFHPVLAVLLHSLGLGHRFPLTVAFAGVEDLGVGLDDIVCVLGVAQLLLLLGHMNKQDRTGQIIQIDRDYIELIVGTGAYPLAPPLVTRLPHFPNTWLTSVCKVLHSVGGIVDINSQRVIPVQREND